jgi:hypothetical protein
VWEAGGAAYSVADAARGRVVNLAGRIARLERRRGSGPCPGCGVARDAGREAGCQRFEVVVLADGEQFSGKPGDRCAVCGRGLVARVVVA